MEKVILSAKDAEKIKPEELFEKLSTSKDGLSGKEAKDRLGVYGTNMISEKKKNRFLKFLQYFWGPIPWMIEAAAVLSAIVEKWEDFAIILVLLMLNAFVGFWQENKADNAIELLKNKLAPDARVLRDGSWKVLPAKELVPGDVIRLRAGDVVPADSKLIEGEYLSVDEAALTGESLPVDKKNEDTCYSGSIVRKGEMVALVIATGMNTYFGKTAKLVEEAKTESHFQKAVIRIGDYLIAIAVVLVTVIVIIELVRHEGVGTTVQFALVLTVAAIPAALPAVLSVTMAVGASALAKKQAIVSKLVAIEEAAGMDVLCSDKTGTITQNKLSISSIKPFGDFSENDVLLCGVLASKEEDNDPIDLSIIKRERQVEKLKGIAEKYTSLEFKPFDPVVKRTEATLKDENGKVFQVAKGAPQAILKLLGDKTGVEKEVNSSVEASAEKGYRSLGVARTLNNEDGSNPEWNFAGLIFMEDPPREDSADTIETAQKMGVEVKMVTGDHVAIAKEIASQVNLGTDIKPVSAFIDKSDDDAEKVVEGADGFAQVYPEHKFRIVKLLQGKNHIVGMTGDGVNDAPALKEADAGIAVDGATDAVKSAADIVLTSPGLSVIIDALRQSRMIFQRMNSYSIYRIAETIRILLFVTAAIIIFNVYPITAIMIILLALLNDVPIMAIAYDNVICPNKPEKWDMKTVLGMASFLGLVGVVFSFGVFVFGREVLDLSTGGIQSLVFLKLAIAGHLTIFLTRTRGPFWSIKPSAMLFWSAVVTKAIATLIVVYGWFVTPIGWKLAGYVWAYALVAFFITDILKVQFYKIIDRFNPDFSGITPASESSCAGQ